MTRTGTLEDLLSARTALVVDGDRRVDDVGARAGQLAAGLQRRGVGRGDSVAFQFGNSVDSVIVYRACWRIGARAVPLHHRFTEREVGDLLAVIDPSVVLRDPSDVDELSSSASARTPGIDARPDDEAVVLFTAGSTGPPKGVRHLHRSLAYKAQLMGEVHGLTADDVVLMPAPLAHVSGLLNGVLVPGVTGMTTVLLSRWSASRALELIEAEGVTFMVGPPTFFIDLMEDDTFAPDRVRSLRVISTGGARVTPGFVERARRRFGAQVKRTYGSTEAPTVATTLAGEDAPADLDGHAIGATELRTIDGELHVRGPELFAGYLDARQTEAVMTADGWFRTGDLASIDDRGGLRITGRLRDVVIRGGENISPREVEDLLTAHRDIRAACVVGLPHERLGEQVAAVVVADGRFTVEDCRRWFEAQGVSAFKTPEVVRTVQSLPRLPTGKVDAERVRAIAAGGA